MIIPGKARPHSRRPTKAHPQVLIIAPDDMYVYEYDSNDQLARVLVEDLPQPAGPNPAMERLAEEVLADNPEVTAR